MDLTFNIPDSTDWLDTPLACLGRVESALRCQVCKDFFDNPVITSCSHTFCSLCIRRCLSAEGKCPACRSGDQELKLRRNWAVQELVDSFRLSRQTVLDFAKDAAARARPEDGAEDDTEGPAAKKRKLDNSGKEDLDVTSDNRRRTRSRGKKIEPSVSQEDTIVIEDSASDYEPDDGLVACPICGRRMKNEFVFRHLDACTGSRPTKSSSNATGSLKYPTSRTAPSPSHNPKRLPTITYSLLKENALRKKLKELGIPDWGPKPLLQRRHTEWMNLWNANCDSVAPKSTRELLRELDSWERTQGGLAAGASTSVMKKDFDTSAWSTTHGNEYKKLIANATIKKEPVKDPEANNQRDDGAVADSAADHQVETTKQMTVDMQEEELRDDGRVAEPAADHQMEIINQTTDIQAKRLGEDTKVQTDDEPLPDSGAVILEDGKHVNGVENHDNTETKTTESVDENIVAEDTAS